MYTVVFTVGRENFILTETILKLMDQECKLLIYMIFIFFFIFAIKECVKFGWILEVFKNANMTEGAKCEDHLN